MFHSEKLHSRMTTFYFNRNYCNHERIPLFRGNGLGYGVSDSGNGLDERFTMPRYALIRQPTTKIVRGSYLAHTIGSEEMRGEDEP